MAHAFYCIAHSCSFAAHIANDREEAYGMIIPELYWISISHLVYSNPMRLQYLSM
jgi:hypothetical protein